VCLGASGMSACHHLSQSSTAMDGGVRERDNYERARNNFESDNDLMHKHLCLLVNPNGSDEFTSVSTQTKL